jgi:hypothetical protein
MNQPPRKLEDGDGLRPLELFRKGPEIELHSDLLQSLEPNDQLRAPGIYWGLILLGPAVAILPCPVEPWGALVAVLGLLPVSVWGLQMYFAHHRWLRTASWMLSNSQPETKEVTGRFVYLPRSKLNIDPSYVELTLVTKSKAEIPSLVKVVHVSEISKTRRFLSPYQELLQNLPLAGNARVFCDASNGEASVVETESGFRLWCKGLFVNKEGCWRKWRWVPRALASYYVAAGLLLIMIDNDYCLRWGFAMITLAVIVFFSGNCREFRKPADDSNLARLNHEKR